MELGRPGAPPRPGAAVRRRDPRRNLVHGHAAPPVQLHRLLPGVPTQPTTTLKKLYGQLSNSAEQQLLARQAEKVVDKYQPDMIWQDGGLYLVEESKRLDFCTTTTRPTRGAKRSSSPPRATASRSTPAGPGRPTAKGRPRWAAAASWSREPARQGRPLHPQQGQHGSCTPPCWASRAPPSTWPHWPRRDGPVEPEQGRAHRRHRTALPTSTAPTRTQDSSGLRVSLPSRPTRRWPTS